MRRFLPLLFVVVLLLLPAQALAAEAPARPIAILVGGLDSQPSSPTWDRLRQALGNQGFGTVLSFSYDPTSITSYLPAQTCQDIATSESILAAWVRAIRDTHLASNVVLVGHSLGGVVALQVAGQEADLAPFLSKVVTIDSPIGGMNTLGTIWFDARNGGSCPAAHQLADRWIDGSATADVMQRLSFGATARGVQVRSYVNDADSVLSAGVQFVPGTSVTEGSWVDGSGLVNHSAVLADGNAVADIAAFVGS